MIDGVDYYRPDKSIKRVGEEIHKIYSGLLARERISALLDIYALLKEKDVPNVDTLIRVRGTTAQLGPVGEDCLPESEEELLKALICILEALEVSIYLLYGASLQQASAICRCPYRKCMGGRSKSSIEIFDGLMLYGSIHPKRVGY